jgi:hypothetical protein
LQALRHRCVQVAPAARADEARHGTVRPAQVVDGRDVGEKAEAKVVAQIGGRLEQIDGLDDDGRLSVLFASFNQAGQRREVGGLRRAQLAHEATLRSS